MKKSLSLVFLLCFLMIPLRALALDESKTDLSANEMETLTTQVATAYPGDMQLVQTFITDVTTFYQRAQVTTVSGDFVGAYSAHFQDVLEWPTYQAFINLYKTASAAGDTKTSQAIFNVMDSAQFWAGILRATRLYPDGPEPAALKDLVSIVGAEKVLGHFDEISKADEYLHYGAPEGVKFDRDQAERDQYLGLGDWLTEAVIKVIYLGQRSQKAVALAAQEVSRYQGGSANVVTLLSRTGIVDDSYLKELLSACHPVDRYSPVKGTMEELDRLRKAKGDAPFRKELLDLIATKSDDTNIQLGAIYYLTERNSPEDKLLGPDFVTALLQSPNLEKILASFEDSSNYRSFTYNRAYLKNHSILASFTDGPAGTPEHQLVKLMTTLLWDIPADTQAFSRTSDQETVVLNIERLRSMFLRYGSPEYQEIEAAQAHDPRVPAPKFESSPTAGEKLRSAIARICNVRLKWLSQ